MDCKKLWIGIVGEFDFRTTWGPSPRIERVLKYERPGKDLISIAGPCSVESPEQMRRIINMIKGKVSYVRGGVFRAGTYPGMEFGLIDRGIISEYCSEAKSNGLNILMEVLDYSDSAMRIYDQFADAYQVGARQMQNYPLLKILGERGRPVFLKRHPGTTLLEFLGAAEHLLAAGDCRPHLIERGSSSQMNHVRWDLSISTIAAIKNICNIPVIVDASHGTGRRDLVKQLTMAGIAAGADGFLVEIHPYPEKSLSDAEQAYPLDKFDELLESIQRLRTIL